jgi:hypothetical protein
MLKKTVGKTTEEYSMKKGKKILVVGLIGLLMVVGLVLGGCRAGCSGNGDCRVRNDENSAIICDDYDCGVFGGEKGDKCDC